MFAALVLQVAAVYAQVVGVPEYSQTCMASMRIFATVILENVGMEPTIVMLHAGNGLLCKRLSPQTLQTQIVRLKVLD